MLQRLLDLPIRRKLYLVVGILVVDLAVVLSIGVFGMWTLSSLRAYVGGEGLWAKAQKDAVNSLGRYALSRDEKDYLAFETALKVPLGDRKARLELEKARPDYLASDAGFLEGGNHPADVRAMAHLFRRFQRVGYIERAISLWREADGVLAELQAEAAGLHRVISSGSLTPRQARGRLARIDEIDARLTRIENEFSSTLGEASRWAKGLLFRVMAAAALLFGGLGLAAALYIGAGVAGGITALSAAAARAERGDLKFRVDLGTRDELGRLADSFNRMAAGLSELERAKSEFLATASHELRTPLALVMAPIESLLAGDLGALNAGQRAMLEVMHNNAIRQLQLVTGLLDFSRADAGKLEIRREPLDAAALTRSIVEGFGPLARGKALSLEVSCELASPVVLLDRYLYERIAFNLLSNAIKFTPRGGAVRVALTQDGGRLRLAVSDTGIGIAPQDRPSLFRKFRQLESSSTRRFEGTGLGLALVREFALLLGGGVSVGAAPLTGAEFVVELDAPPCAPGTAGAAGPAASPAQRYAPAEEGAAPLPDEEGGVLIAEDNAELASYLRVLLEVLGPVRVARDGEQALLLARTRRPELIVADVMMPRLDGLGLCRALKANPATASIPVVLLTALTDRDSLARGWKAGADEYLFKPFHPKEVVTRARSLLAAARARRLAGDAMAAKNAELERANREARQANEELVAFNRSISHDLRAPLHNLEAFCALLEKGLPPDAGAQNLEFMARIRSSISRMDAIINGLLKLSRVMGREFSVEETDLSAAARAIAADLARAHPLRKVAFIAGPDIAARADSALAGVLLQNLLENAWKYTARREDANVEFGRLRRDGEDVYFVRDDGAGFDMTHTDGLFKPFQRLHSANDFPGSGIGLATVRRIVERHGGRVWAEAAPDAGATIFFTLAAPTAAAADRRAAA